MEKVQILVHSVIEDKLNLQLSKEKTKVTTFKDGFDFLGFHINNKYFTIRTKSVERFRDKIRNLTTRSHNFSSSVIIKINRVIRGYANYHNTDFSNVKAQFISLDQFTRKRLRCMKKTRISRNDNFRIRNKFFRKKGLLFLYDFVS